MMHFYVFCCGDLEGVINAVRDLTSQHVLVVGGNKYVFTNDELDMSIGVNALKCWGDTEDYNRAKSIFGANCVHTIRE